MLYGWSTQYLLYLIGIIVVVYAQTKINTAYQKYRKIENRKHISGKEVARKILDHHQLYDVRVEVSNGGRLSDHYDPVHKIVRLSSDIYYNNSIAALGIAAHEVGHAIQHKEKYGAIALRNRLLPMVNIASQLGWIIILIGLFLFAQIPWLIYIGISMLVIILLFQIITLPIELNASNRAMQELNSLGLMYSQENYAVRSILNAAAFTYIAAVLATVTQILRIFIMILGRSKQE